MGFSLFIWKIYLSFQIANNVTSFALHDEFLLLSTHAHTCRCINRTTSLKGQCTLFSYTCYFVIKATPIIMLTSYWSESSFLETWVEKNMIKLLYTSPPSLVTAICVQGSGNLTCWPVLLSKFWKWWSSEKFEHYFGLCILIHKFNH